MKIIAAIFFYFFLAKVNGQENKLQVSYFNFSDTIVPTEKKLMTALIINGNRSVSYKVPYEKKAPGMYLVSKTGTHSKYEFYAEIEYEKKYVYKDFTSDSSFFESEIDLLIIKKSEIYSDSLHPFVWQITNEQKKIGNQKCKKAMMQFRGRNYTAWFDETINISNGPWKFGGLPGLILEIYDDTFTVYWTVSKLEYVENLELPAFPVGVTATYADYKKMYREKFEKIRKSFQSSDALSDPNCVSCKGSKKTITNNSVENFFLE